MIIGRNQLKIRALSSGLQNRLSRADTVSLGRLRLGQNNPPPGLPIPAYGAQLISQILLRSQLPDPVYRLPGEKGTVYIYMKNHRRSMFTVFLQTAHLTFRPFSCLFQLFSIVPFFGLEITDLFLNLF